jgi:hypothetical protein
MKILKKIVFSIYFDIISMAILFMWLMPFGTFDYTEIGFYLAIIQAILISVSTRYFLKKYQKDYMGKIK